MTTCDASGPSGHIGYPPNRPCPGLLVGSGKYKDFPFRRKSQPSLTVRCVYDRITASSILPQIAVLIPFCCFVPVMMYFGDYLSAGLAAASSLTQGLLIRDHETSQSVGKKVDYYQRNLKTITSIYNLTVWPSTFPSLPLHLPTNNNQTTSPS